ncbi:carboxypeptidase regulatory-like domain-containing protein [Microbacterium sp. BK668]|uniref:carboxypeptidase regulatory-like domain-containing protein n=1 Tax=Microbacterium sp. BK668 TaxID=2512118 RepID=UPI0010EB6C24|nr:carboxypeptidase regulatory-like domain-containing protein [Microbacterium sp. BK668]TDN91432.1 carboxypeptidase family protein [Microbacterium sp. BK668]
MSSSRPLGSSEPASRPRARAAAAVLAIAALIVAGITWPSAAWAAGDSSISGAVRYADDAAGIAGATVELYDAAGPGEVPVATVTTDAEGQYSLTDLEPGDYRIFAEGDAALYVPQWYSGKTTFASADLVTVAAGTHLVGFDVYLADAQNSIAGSIRYANDAVGIAGATVEFYDAAGPGDVPAATVTTDAEGKYVVQNLPYGDYRIFAEGDAALYVPQWYSGKTTFATADLVTVAAGTHLVGFDVYLADAQNSIAGSIRYANDAVGIAGATVEFYDAAGAGDVPAATVTTDAEGKYVVQNLPYGDYRIFAEGDPALYVPQWYSGKTTFATADLVTVAAGTHLVGFDVYLADAQNSIAGSIRYANDAVGIAGATVEFYDAAGAGDVPAATVTTDAEGKYVVQNLPYGDYRIFAEGDPALYVPQWYSGKTTFATADLVTVAAGTHLVGFDVYLDRAPDIPTGYVSGRVVDGQTGGPLAGASVALFGADGDGVTPVATATADADGVYVFATVLPGEYAVRAEAAGRITSWFGGADFAGATVLNVQPGGEYTGLQITLWATSNSVSGYVYDGATGAPLAGAGVGLYAEGDGITPIATVLTDAEGFFSAAGLPAGDYKVRASAAGLRPYWYSAAEFADATVFAVAAGTHLSHLTFHLWPGLRTLSGTVYQWESSEPVAGVEVRLHPTEPADAPPVATATTGADGTYTFVDFAPDGEFVVQFAPEAAASTWYYQKSSRDAADALTSAPELHIGNVNGFVGQPLFFEVEGSVTITGSPAPGQVLTAATDGVFTPQPATFTYQWYLDGVQIEDATGPTYTVRPQDRSGDLTVTVVASSPGYQDAQSTSPAVFVAPFSLADIAAALDIDEGMAISLFGGSRGVFVSDTSFTGYPRAGGDYVVLSTGRASDVMLPAEPDTFLSSALDGARGVDGNDMTGITISATAPEASRCLAFDLKFGSEEFPEFVGTSFNDVFTAETPTSDISIQGTEIVAPHNYAYDIAGNILSINAIVGFAPVAGNAMDGWTPSLTARVPLGAGEAAIILTLQDIGDSGYDSAVLLDNVRLLPTAECDDGGTTPTDPITGPTPVVVVQPTTPGGEPSPAQDGVTACSVLSVVAGDWAPAPVELSYQWKVGGVAVEGATGATFAVPPDAAGRAVTVVVTGSKPGYPPVSIESAPTPVVTLCELVGSTPIIQGVPETGETLTAVLDPEWGPAPVELGYQWLRDGLPIPAANGSTYLVAASDVGRSIRVVVTGTKPGYAPLSLWSAPVTIAGGLLQFDPAPVPTIIGAPVVAGSLEVSTGEWGPAPVNLAIQWMRNGAPIAGADGTTYTPTALDAGTLLTAVVTGSKDGYETTSRTSAPSGPVQLATLTTAVPLVTGAPVVDGELTVDPGAWGPAPVQLGVQWTRNGAPILGADGLSYRPTADDLGATLRAAVTGSKPGYSTATVTSAGATVVAATLTPTPTPAIIGDAVVASTLQSDPGLWGPQPVSLALEWLRNGVVVSTAPALTLVPGDVGATIALRVTASKPGYTTEVRTSPGVAVAPGTLDPAPTPVIVGEPLVGQTLTAVPGTWGPEPVSLAFQWRADGAVIADATGATLALSPSLLGAAITVTVTGSKAGYTSVGRTSAPTAPVQEAVLSPAPTPTISGSPVFGQTLTVVTGTWGPAPVVLAIEWLRNGVPIPAATGSTYTPVPADVGTEISVRVTGSKAGFPTVVRTSAAVTIQPATLSPAPTPTIVGAAVVDGTLTASVGTWGPAPVDLTIQWLRNGSVISTGPQLALTAADLGSTIAVRVTGTKAGYTTEVRTSLGVVVAPGTLSPTPTPGITGTAVVGQTLTAVPGAWGPAPVTLAYQWNAGGVPIPGADGATFVVTSAYLGQVITVTVTGSKPGYTSVSRTSAPTPTVANPVLSPTPIPTITGSPIVGQVLTAVPGVWGPAPVTLTYQWNANGAPIPGATASTWTVTAVYLGQTITVTVTGSKPGYTSVSRTSAPTGPVTNPVLSPTPIPTISGIAEVGRVLTAVPGTWGPAPVTLAYQWLRNGAPISGANKQTYELRLADLGARISVRVTGSKPGYVSVTRTSAETAPVALQSWATAPTPTISGTLKVGFTLTANPGTWSPAPGALAYQWYADGVAIPGATGSTLALNGAREGDRITVSVTATGTGMQPTTRTSAPTGPVAPGSLTIGDNPWISGVTKVGQTLRVHVGDGWGPKPVQATFTWKRDGVAIPGATGGSDFWTYRLTAADVGRRITVTVVFAKTGYTSVTRTTAPTGVVTAK